MNLSFYIIIFLVIPSSISAQKDKIYTSLDIALETPEDVYILDLSYTEVISIPNSIEKLINLEELHLNSAELYSLPESIGKLINLKWISLANNYSNEIPSLIENLKKLEGIYLEDHSLRDFPHGL